MVYKQTFRIELQLKDNRGDKEKMNNFKKLIKNSKAISPIFATLILIAIAVIAGVVVYMFTSEILATMTGGGTAGTEKVSVQAANPIQQNKVLEVFIIKVPVDLIPDNQRCNY